MSDQPDQPADEPRPLRAKVQHRAWDTFDADGKRQHSRDEWWVTLIAANGEPLAHSEMLSSRANAAKNAAAMGVTPEHIEWPKDSE